MHARPDLCHQARLHPLDLHLIAAPNEVVAAQRAEEQYGQHQIADKSVNRIEQRDMPARGYSEQHFAAVPEYAEASEADRQGQVEGFRQYTNDGDRKEGARKNLRQEIDKKARAP